MKWKETEGLEGQEFEIYKIKEAHSEESQNITQSDGFQKTSTTTEKREDSRHSELTHRGTWAETIGERQTTKDWMRTSKITERIADVSSLQLDYIWNEEQVLWKRVRASGSRSRNENTKSKNRVTYEGKQRQGRELDKRHVYSLLNALTRLTNPEFKGYLHEARRISQGYTHPAEQERYLPERSWRTERTTHNEWANREEEREGYWTITEAWSTTYYERRNLQTSNLNTLLWILDNWRSYISWNQEETITERQGGVDWKHIKERRKTAVRLYYGRKEANFKRRLIIRETKTRSTIMQTTNRCKRMKKKKTTEKEEKAELEGMFTFEKSRIRTNATITTSLQDNFVIIYGDSDAISINSVSVGATTEIRNTKGETETALIITGSGGVTLVYCRLEIHGELEDIRTDFHQNNNGEISGSTEENIYNNSEVYGDIYVMELIHHPNSDRVFLIDELTDEEDIRTRTRRRKLVCT